MKAITKCFVVFLLVLGAKVADAKPFDEEAGYIRANDTHCFVFKMDRQYIGALVEIFYSDGKRIVSQKLSRRKVVIDFGRVRFGEYTIRINKGDNTQEYKYVKK